MIQPVETVRRLGFSSLFMSERQRTTGNSEMRKVVQPYGIRVMSSTG
jgi:hypothetical protein